VRGARTSDFAVSTVILFAGHPTTSLLCGEPLWFFSEALYSEASGPEAYTSFYYPNAVLAEAIFAPMWSEVPLLDSDSAWPGVFCGCNRHGYYPMIIFVMDPVPGEQVTRRVEVGSSAVLSDLVFCHPLAAVRSSITAAGEALARFTSLPNISPASGHSRATVAYDCPEDFRYISLSMKRWIKVYRPR